MARIAGVATQKDTRGNITHITIDLKKHKEAVPVLKELGLMEKTLFEKECEDAVSVKECFDEVRAFINTLEWKK